jgi:hypothetical protein
MHDRTPGTSRLDWMLYFLAGGVAGASVALLLALRRIRATRDKAGRPALHVDDAAQVERRRRLRTDFKDQLIRRGQKIRDLARHRVDHAVAALAGDGGAKLPG